ncbi:acyl-CoA dehydrogenase family protein [Alteribacillus sp. JSM 102045]|uniref:acyl-CoA dehydrogenase family protein n=1 Tax=Alteribacillus sp. JSM 102045 TaxID=1562101 RepID=UPI0035C1A256
MQQDMFCKDLIDTAKALSNEIRIDQKVDSESALLKVWPLIVRNGFHRLLIEPSFDGWGLDLRQYIDTMQQLAYGDGPLALAVHVHNYAVKIINELGDKTLKQRLKTWLDEGNIFSLARTEYKRDYRYNFSTKISHMKSSSVLSGQKDFCTLAGLADCYVVFAQTEVSDPSMDSLQVCIAIGNAPTVEVIKTNGFDSMVASSTYSVRFNDYELSPADLVGQPGEIAKLENPDTLTIGICAINVGMADLGIELFERYYRGKNDNVEVMRWLGQMDVLLRSAELLLDESINSRPHMDSKSGIYLRRAKSASDTLLQNVTEGAIKYLGIDGIMSKNKLIYLRNNSYATRILPPSTQKSLIALGTERIKVSHDKRGAEISM